MKIRALLISLAVLFESELLHGQELIIRNAIVIDGTGAPPRKDVDVCVTRGRIVSVRRGCTIEGRAPVVDASRLYVLPGFVDMHVHLFEHGRDEKGEIRPRVDWDFVRHSLRLLLDHGVTTIRDPGSETEAAITLRHMLARGNAEGPRLLTAGRIINASAFNPEPFRQVRTTDEIRREIRWQKAAGVDFIKLYSSMPPDFTKAVIEEAHALRLPVIGHLGRTTWTEAARLGIDHITHGAPWTRDLLPRDAQGRYSPSLFGRVYWLESLHLALPALDTMIRELVTRGVSVDPTLIAYHTKFFGNDARWLNNPDNRLLPSEVIGSWAAGSFTKDWTTEQYTAAKRVWPRMLALTRHMFERGVRLSVGTDAPTPWIVPGPSFHDELTFLRDAGIPELAIIKLATLDGARALRRDQDFGTVQTGRWADLVLLSADPLERIENTRSIAAVIQGGRVACASVALRGSVRRPSQVCRRRAP